MYRIIIIATFALGLVSCTNNRELNFALEFAGENRTELQAVLYHYKKGTEQYRAARYLIENMPYNYASVSPSVERFKISIPKVSGCSDQKLIEIVVDQANKECNYPYDRSIIYDAHIITAEYLINHIDNMFELKQLPWNKHLSFVDFCEMLLPYRIANEPLEEWVESYSSHFQPIIDSIANPLDIVLNAQAIVEDINKVGSLYVTNLGQKPSFGPSFLLRSRLGVCRESTQLTLYALRSVGIPCAIDEYLQSPTFNGGHQWNVIKDTNGDLLPFWISIHSLNRGNKLDRKAGKIYRSTYAAYKNRSKKDHSLQIKRNGAKYRDVTAEYYGNNRVELDISPQEARGICHMYLSLFSRGSYTPIDIACISQNIVTFIDVEPNVIYQLTKLNSNNSYETVGYPFIPVCVDSIHYFKPNKEQTQRVVIKRKYPMRKDLAQRMDYTRGATIYGSRTNSMTDKALLYTIKDSIYSPYNIFQIYSESEYKYVEIKYNPDIEQLPIAELSIYSDSKSIRFNIYDGNAPRHFPELIDKDLISYAKVGNNGSLIIELKERAKIDSILYTPVNDDNFIEVDQRYELLYNNGHKGWISLGEKIATADSLVFDIPKNSLLWLRNHTKGVEEQVFFEVDGMQQFPPKLF